MIQSLKKVKTTIPMLMLIRKASALKSEAKAIEEEKYKVLAEVARNKKQLK